MEDTFTQLRAVESARLIHDYFSLCNILSLFGVDNYITYGSIEHVWLCIRINIHR